MRKGSSTGFGLLTMKERAVSSNGYFEIRSSPGQGTTIRISWRIAGQTARQSEAATSRVRER
jgi:two-component system NarL family sensor kinase